MVELLAPVGDFECLKAAVQNGADCVYFGANLFSARASATNFDMVNLEKAISYAKLRGVRTNLTLNTLIKNDEFSSAYELAKKAYEFGIDAIIVQDLGLGLKLIHDFPDLPIHASTQMSVHNLEGVLKLQKLGFKRVVLARELSAEEIAYICQNSNVEIECFIHGALCICYSGQCLFSSMIGGRSGNRGKCAQPCRLNYTLVNQAEKALDNGYILSPRDLCGLDYLPFLIKNGVTSFKIEGRMKTPEYVATVTRIYRKYIDLAKKYLFDVKDKNIDLTKTDNTKISKFEIDVQDKKELLQVFNRGLSSNGHLDKEPNKNLIFKDKPNNMGLPLGIVQNYNKNKGYVTLKLKEPLQIGDTISIENETGTYTVSELMDSSKSSNLKNIALGKVNQTVTIGRMKGNINIKDKVFKMSSKELNTNVLNSINSEKRKVLLNAKVTIKRNLPISICITSANNIPLYSDLNLTYSLEEAPVDAINKPLTKESVVEKLNKTGNSFYDFSYIKIDLDNNIFLPKLSLLNELRRNSLEQVELWAIEKIKRDRLLDKKLNNQIMHNSSNLTILNKPKHNPKISVLLNILNKNYDYSNLENIDNLYIPLKYFANKKYSSILEILSSKFDLYIYLPTIIKANYKNMFKNNIENAVKLYNVKGFVFSNVSNFVLLEDLCKKSHVNTDKNSKIRTNENYYDSENNADNHCNLELIANYTFNIYNNFTIDELAKLGISKYTVSPELDKASILSLNSNCKQEMIVYGKIPLMNINYCFLGKTNKCYPQCDTKCANSSNIYYLKDRLNMNFEIIPDNIQTVTTIYNSKTLSILPSDFNLDFARIDILHEDVDEINSIVSMVRANKRFEGKNFTNGNLNREI
ncbi:MAG: U32 family peptidase [Clostridia bacterium]|nr:U32 family peptidase [Clostridia bacterium]